MPGKKLLVADDSLTIQKVIRLALSNEGYDIQAISDGGDAIQQIATFRPDCVLIDVSLPTRTAFEIKREVNGMEDHTGIRFILMSSAFEKIDDAQAEEVGFDGRLTKPFDPAHLRQVLGEVLNAPRAPKNLPPSIGFPEESEFTSSSISLEPPRGFPSSDFDLPLTPPSPPQSLSESPESTESDDELWGKHEEDFPPPRPDRPERGELDEIKQLTESTIRMSGLADIPSKDNDEFGWKVNEPTIKPPSSMSDLGGSSFHMGSSHAPNQESAEMPPPLPESQRPFSSSAMPASGAISGDKMEEIVRRQVQETLEKIAQQILPEVAERVIKAEINRLLNEKF